MLVAEETGRAAVPEPLVEHAAVAVPLLAEHSGDARVAPVLEAAAAGAARVAVALPQESLVAGAGQADWLLLGAGDELHLVPRSGVRLVEEPANDRLRRLHRVSYAPVTATRIVEGAGAREAMARAFDRGALHAAAQCLGLAERMIEIGVEYASERRQFGQADRRLPGAQAPARERAGQARVRAPGRLRRRGVARGLRRENAGGRFARQACGRRGRGRVRANRRCRRTARWAIPGRSICTST